MPAPNAGTRVTVKGIDVRQPDEYAAGHIEGATNVPLRELMQHLDDLPTTGTPILLYCHSQKRATHAVVILTTGIKEHFWGRG